MNKSDPTPTVGETTHKRLRDDIVFGRLRPGAKLRLSELSTTYGASVSTLREILSGLAAENFVIAEGQRGFEVAPVSHQDLEETAQLRAMLEIDAMKSSFEAGGVEWEGQVIAAHHKLHYMERKMLDGDSSVLKTWKRYDWEFHQALIMACGSELLMRTHGLIFDRYLRYQLISLTFRGQAAADEHQELKDAALARDFEKARDILQYHVISGSTHPEASDILNQYL